MSLEQGHFGAFCEGALGAFRGIYESFYLDSPASTKKRGGLFLLLSLHRETPNLNPKP